MPRSLLGVFVVAVLAGCGGRSAPPAPFEIHNRGGPSALSEPPGSHPDRVKVAGGDTLYGLSRRWGVPMRAIIDANGLTPPYRLVAGVSLALPQVRTHTVQAGDTLASVARRYGVDASTLAATNHLAPPYVVRTGETLILPAPVETVRAVSPPPAAIARPAPSAAESPPPPRIVAVSPLASPGSEAAASAPPPAHIVAVSPLASSAPHAAIAPPPPPALPPIAVPAPAAAPEPAPAEAKTAERLAALPPATVSSKGFLWPVRGRVISAYGTDSDGTHNDGINIAAPVGTPVLAADAGEVAYAGNELKGYGNLILLKHASGFISAYAHNETLLVKRGDKVIRGQPIAKVGATGAVAEPQLHFEIRRGARALDPAEYLPVTAATASR